MGGSWTMTDAWVFAAIADDRPARAHTLAEVIAITDGINHAVLTEEEFTAAAGRLAAAGLIDADAARERYWPTEAGANLRRRWRHGAFGWIEAIPPACAASGSRKTVTGRCPQEFSTRRSASIWRGQPSGKNHASRALAQAIGCGLGRAGHL